MIMMEKMLLMMVTMMTLAHTEDDMITFVMKMKEEFEELKSTMKDLAKENAELKAENFDLKINIQKLEAKGDELRKDVQELNQNMAETFSELTVKNDQLECKATEIVRDVSFLKNPPYYHICVYQQNTDVTKSNVQFSKELYLDCNMCDGEEGNSPANFNLASGVYTNGWPGTYTVTWDLQADDDHGYSYVSIYLRKSDVLIEESHHYSRYTGSSGKVAEQGGRTMILRMETGDTLSLWCENCSANVLGITFCISLNTFDVL